jgi:transposase
VDVAEAQARGVLRLLRGEELELVSRSPGVTAATLSGWREAFLAAGEASPATRPTGGAVLESNRLKARLGEMQRERELLEAKIAALEVRDPRPLTRRRPMSSAFFQTRPASPG